MTDAASNPVAADSDVEKALEVESTGRTSAVVDMEKALKGLRDQTVSEEEAVRIMTELMDARIQQLSLVTVKSAFGRLSEAPANYPQMTIFFMTSLDLQDAAMRGKAPLLFMTSCVMVLAQILAAVAVTVGAFVVSCTTNDNCEKAGRFCGVGYSGKCNYCGTNTPYAFEVDGVPIRADAHPDFPTNLHHPELYLNFTNGEVCSNPFGRFTFSKLRNSVMEVPPEFTLNWCAACVSGATLDVDITNLTSDIATNILAMSRLDWLVLVFTSLIVACGVAGELRDIDLCDLAVRKC